MNKQEALVLFYTWVEQDPLNAEWYTRGFKATIVPEEVKGALKMAIEERGG